MAARGQKNERCCKRQTLTSRLNCGNPNAYYRNVKFAVQRATTIQQKNRGVAAFLFKFCFFNLHCSWCICLRYHYCCNRSKFDYRADKIGHSVANSSLPLHHHHHPVSIRFLPRSRRWPDTPHPLRDCFHTFLPSRSICSFLYLQPDFLHTLFYLLPPRHFWPFLLSLPIHFQHHCLFQCITIIPSNHMSIPSYSIRLCHSIQRFLQTQHLHQLLHLLSIH